jgi:hypothetical protein
MKHVQSVRRLQSLGINFESKLVPVDTMYSAWGHRI